MSEQQPALIEALGARGVIREWAKGAQTLAILEAVHRLGWLDTLREPTPLPDLTTPSWAPERTQGVTDVLKQVGVVTETAGAYQLTPAFAALVNGASGVDLESVLASVRLDLAALEKLDGTVPGLTGTEALIVAKDSGVVADPVTQMLYRSVYAAIPEVEAELAGGGPMLDLGCGIGGALLTTAQLYPHLKLLGVDIVPEVVAEAERRRDELGLTEQVQLRCADAQTLDERAVFKVAYWAQAFFPDNSRPGTLSALRRALTADGLLVLQEQPAGPTDVVQQGLRGIAAGRTAEELAAEARAAGFVLVRQVTTNLGNLAVMRNQQQ
ncbi:methyltransferase domain-containing protein [Kineosporia rhizophila]|uniref:SAM-dependent methyltransferase n=1 Tax=Kineosporia rhizophila TaxID=84633 RepID=UPI001E34F437|nr:class I SAM-dependent methyltransferase [Kineosporia rhizophila]MCE0538161.1 methyltransferase domain-containing protein [Kineosporia rhizophila]